ncbi:RNA-directed DNA polymerase [Abeliophyllum distichum]|uniref:RNA-directed DNA polymerase n=1 Tax=Abeliophyllum distichum TaxID=126358 RepID=A0ABD1SYE9_9LAMI
MDIKSNQMYRNGTSIMIPSSKIIKFCGILSWGLALSSENPLDPKINKGTFTAKIELLDEHKGKVVRAKAMAYSPKDREEFAVKIKELLDLQVIEPSKSPFSSPAFMVRKEAEKRRGKARMVIDYSQLNKEFPDEIQDQKQLMRLLGCLTYAESFIQDLTKMRTPLQKKLKKDHKWNWTKDDSNYVRKIKAKLKNLPLLYHPHKDDKMIIETDASQEFWGAALKTITNENEEKLCSYASGTFNTAEKNYHINEKEILAMKKAITKFRLYIISNKFLIRTDTSTCNFFLKCQVHPDYKQGRKMTDLDEQIADMGIGLLALSLRSLPLVHMGGRGGFAFETSP